MTALGAREVVRTRYRRAEGGFAAEQEASDWVAIEEPLEIRISGERWLVTMRTPGNDRELTAGLLLAEGIIRSRAELGALVHCGRPGEAGYGNVIDVTLAPGAESVWRRLDDAARAVVAGSACGVCGRATIDGLVDRCAVLDGPGPDVARVIAASQGTVMEQKNFALTGGVHAATLVTADGQSLATFEDVGRHNAVDKLLGHRLLETGKDASGLFLWVSGRASFEMVQKAVVSRCRGLVSLSAPTSLAIETARRFNLALVGFLRDETFSVYS